MTAAKPKSRINGSDESWNGGDHLRRGPWSVEEDHLLSQYISSHGEGRWNSLAKYARLNRSGKSCRLRWLNYLKPDIKRGNLTPHERLLILDLHSKWGNRWSKIAKQLPGRTDNEIKNYWRTKVQRQARRESQSLEGMTGQDHQTKIVSSCQTDPCQESSKMTTCSGYELHGFWNSSAGDNDQWKNRVDDDGDDDSGICYYNDCYNVETSFHVDEVDWFGKDGFWNSDELWEFRRPV